MLLSWLRAQLLHALRAGARHGLICRDADALQTGGVVQRLQHARERDRAAVRVCDDAADGAATISFTLPKTDLPAADPVLDSLARELDAAGVERDPDIAKISLIGAGMKSHPGVAAEIFEAIAEAGINIEIISTSSIRVSCVVRASEVDRAVNVVHERLKLAEDVLYEGAG